MWKCAVSQADTLPPQESPWEQETTFLVGAQKHLLLLVLSALQTARAHPRAGPELRETGGWYTAESSHRGARVHTTRRWTRDNREQAEVLLNLAHKQNGRYQKPARDFNDHYNEWTRAQEWTTPVAHKAKLLFIWGKQSRGFSFIRLVSNHHREQTAQRLAGLATTQARSTACERRDTTTQWAARQPGGGNHITSGAQEERLTESHKE